MSFESESGTRFTSSTFPATADADVVKVLTADVYERRAQMSERGPEYGTNADSAGTLRTLRFPAGHKMRQSQINLLFRDPAVTSMTPATGGTGAAVNAVVKGSDLDGVSAVTVGGTAVTNLVKVSPSEIRFTIPSGQTTGAKNLVLTGDKGSITKTAIYTVA